jgi:hypothetical protein
MQQIELDDRRTGNCGQARSENTLARPAVADDDNSLAQRFGHRGMPRVHVCRERIKHRRACVIHLPIRDEGKDEIHADFPAGKEWHMRRDGLSRPTAFPNFSPVN